MIQLQCNSPFFDHLLAFSAIRKQHDALYVSWAPKLRTELEGLDLPDRFKMRSGVRDGAMRQRCVDGSRFVAHASADAPPTSKFLRDLGAVLTAARLGALDAALDAAVAADATVGASKDRLAAALASHIPKAAADGASHLQMAVKLALLTVKRRTATADGAPAAPWSMATLWADVCRRTDEVYCAVEGVPTASGPTDALTVYEATLAALVATLEEEAATPTAEAAAAKPEGGTTEEGADKGADTGAAEGAETAPPSVQLSLGGLKDPFRIVEKALDECAAAAAHPPARAHAQRKRVLRCQRAHVERACVRVVLVP